MVVVIAKSIGFLYNFSFVGVGGELIIVTVSCKGPPPNRDAYDSCPMFEQHVGQSFKNSPDMLGADFFSHEASSKEATVQRFLSIL